MLKRASLFLAVLALAVPMVACGGDDGDGGGEVTTEQFAKEANNVCTEFGETTRDASQKLQEGATPEEAVSAVDELKAAGSEGRERIKALELPSGDDEETAKRFVDTSVTTIDKTLPKFDALRDAIEAKDQEAIQGALADIGDEPPENAESDRLAEELGATACVE